MPSALPPRRFRAFAGFCCRWVHLCLLGAAGLGLAAVATAQPAGELSGELFSPPAVAFERFDAENLLPQSSVYDLTERDDDYLWLVTLDGLVRFDGVRQKVFDRSSDPGLETTRLTALWDDQRKGDLWLGTEDGRLVLFRAGRFRTFAALDPELGAVTSLRLSKNGRLFLFRHHGAEEVAMAADGNLRRVGEVAEGSGAYACGSALLGDDHRFWQAGEQGMFALPLPAELERQPKARQCQQDALGGFWLRSTAGPLWRVMGERIVADPRASLLPADAIPFAEDLAGNLWLRLADPPRLGRLDRDGKLWRYGAESGIDPTGEVVRGYFDREAGLWIASNTALYRYFGEPIGSLELRHAGGEVAVASHFEAADGSVYLSTRDQRFFRLSRGGALEEWTSRDRDGRLVLRPELFRPAAAVMAPVVYQAFAAAAGAVWIGTDAGLLSYRDGRLRFFPAGRYAPGQLAIAGAVNDILPEAGGLWLATGQSVARLENDRITRVWGPPDGVEAGVLTLLRDRAGVLWAGTRGGVLRLEGDRFVAVPGLGPEIGQARALYQDEQGRLWVGTYDQGLYRRRGDGGIEHTSPKEGFAGSGVFTIKVDRRGFLWTTSNRGLLRTRLADVDRLLSAGAGAAGSEVPAVWYGRGAGLPSSECNGGFRVGGYSCRAGGHDEAWCIHTLGGIAVARLDAVRVVEEAPSLAIEEVWVDGVPRAIDGGLLRLLPEDRNLLIRFTAIAFEGAREVSFRYRLDPYDRGWVETGQRREALFGDLPPGDYVFEVLATSREGKVSPAPARLQLVVAPAFWERTSFRVLALLAAVAWVWGLVRLRLRFLSRRHAEREMQLREAADELELRVRERTVELAAEVAERRRAEHEARQASAAKSAFLAQMSHELRTPMNAIIGLSEILSRSQLSEKQQEWVATVCASGEALLSIIDDILDFSRIEAGRIEVEAREFDPAALVKSALAIVASLAAAKGLDLRYSCTRNLPAAVVGDAPRLRQVLLNLLGNAIKFTHQGSITLLLDITPEGEGWRLELAVRDTGIGIAPEAQARVFEPFTQADASMSRRFGGSGLGLAICQRVMAALGGRLLLESRLGEGSTFTIEYPVGRAREAEPAAAPEPPRDQIELGHLRVLVAEDDLVNQLVSRSLLEALGLGCQVVGRGEEVLEILAKEDFEVVLMDLHMPGMSGLEASRQLRQTLAPPRQPYLVALTAAVTPEDRVACQEAGMNDFLAKPIREQDLRTALENAVRWWQGREALPAQDAISAG